MDDEPELVDAITRRQGWYVTAAHTAYCRDIDAPRKRPTTEPHLKRLGELRTACGLTTHTWTTFWLEEPSLVPDVCGACVESARSATIADRRRRPGAVTAVAGRPDEPRTRRRQRAAPLDAAGSVLPPRSVRTGRLRG
jgi:hypothetical protein